MPANSPCVSPVALFFDMWHVSYLNTASRNGERMTHWGQRRTVQRGVQELRHIRWRAGHVYLYPTQRLVPQCLALSENIFERGGADFRFGVVASLFLRNKRNTNADCHLCWVFRNREQSPRFNYATEAVKGKAEVRFATPRDCAISVRQ